MVLFETFIISETLNKILYQTISKNRSSRRFRIQMFMAVGAREDFL